MTKIQIGGLLLLALPVFGASAMSFDESVALASANNARLRQAQANLLAAEHRTRAARSGFLPQVSGDIGYSDASDERASNSVGLSVRQNLFSGFQDTARLEQARANEDAARAALVLAKAQLSHDLKTAYAGLLHAQDNVALTESILRRLEENLRFVELRFESGRENKGSFLLTQASVAQARLEYLQAQQALASAQAELARVLGTDAGSDLRATGIVPVNTPPVSPDFAALLKDVPQVQEAQARARAAEEDVRIARSGYLPSVDITGSVNRKGDDFPPDGRRNVVGASVSIPIFTGGRNFHTVRAALSETDAAQANRQSVEQERLVQLKQDYAAYVEAVGRLEVDREFVQAAETRARIARARYQNGLISFEEWDRIESDLIQRQKALLASQRNRIQAEARWELAQGRGVIP